MDHSVDCLALGVAGEAGACTCGLEATLDVVRIARLFCDGMVGSIALHAALKRPDETRAGGVRG